jgi:hypothetical protein
VLHLKAGTYYELSATAEVQVFSTPSHPVGLSELGATINVSLTAVPEPSTVWLSGLGLAALGVASMKRRQGRCDDGKP